MFRHGRHCFAHLLGQRWHAVALLWPLLAGALLGSSLARRSAGRCAVAAALCFPGCRPPRLRLPLLAQLLARVLVPCFPIGLLALAGAACSGGGRGRPGRSRSQQEQDIALRATASHARSGSAAGGLKEVQCRRGAEGRTSRPHSCSRSSASRVPPCRSARTRAARLGGSRPSAAGCHCRCRCRLQLPAGRPPWRARATRARRLRAGPRATRGAGERRQRRRRPAGATCTGREGAR